tara:strand:- start:136 stop:1281 length:1146 start_codon:yes stop_codon:yes gene_type:complete
MSLIKRKKSPYWWTDFTVAGERIQESTKVRIKGGSKKLAQQYHDDRQHQERRLAQGLPGQSGPAKGVTVAVAIEAFQAYKYPSVSNRSATKYDRAFSYLDPKRFLHTINSSDILAIREKLLKSGGARSGSKKSNSTINEYIQCFWSLFRFSIDNEWLIKNPCHKSIVRALPQGPEKTPVIPHEIIEAIYTNGDSILRDAIYVCRYTGLRVGNIAPLRWDQINLDDAIISISGDRTKKSNAITIPIDGPLLSFFEARKPYARCEYVLPKGDRKGASKSYANSPYTSNNISMKFTKICLEFNFGYAIKNVHGEEDWRNYTFHDLRHTYLSELAQAGQDLLPLSKLAGHRSTKSTERYVHLDIEDVRGLKKNVTKPLHPKLKVV